MSIAYLVADFPKPSETFVSREVLTLRRLGLDVRPFAFNAPAGADAINLDAGTRRLAADVDYLARGQLARHAARALPDVFSAWRDNGVMQSAATAKSNPHLRLLRAACLARRLQAAGIRHLHAHWPYATQVAWLVHRLTGISFSVSIHAHEVEYDHGHFPQIFADVSFAAFCNRAAMERLLQRLPAAARERSHLVYHGVDLERFRPLLFPAEHTPLRVISAGRLTRTKGFDRLVRACARFQALGGEVELTILGDGGAKAELQQLARALAFTQHLHLPGWLPHDQISEQLARSHLFALMADTAFHDGLPNVVLEAMASARPVILSPIPAAEEAVANGVEGFILDSAGDEPGLVRALQQCAADPSRLPDMGRAARARMEKVFDATVHAGRLKTLLEAQLAGAPSARRAPMPCADGRFGELVTPGAMENSRT